MAYVFGATDLLATLQLSLTNWEVQGTTNNAVQDFAQVQGRTGDVLSESNAFNLRSEFTAEYISTVIDPAGATENIKLGGVGYATAAADKVVVTSVAVTQSAGQFARLRITYHRHSGQDSTKAHATREVTVALPTCGFGVITTPHLDGAIADEVTSCEWSATVEHADALDKSGAFLRGASYNLRYEGSAEGTFDTAAPSVASGWNQDASELREGNTTHKTFSIRAHKHGTLSVPA